MRNDNQKVSYKSCLGSLRVFSGLSFLFLLAMWLNTQPGTQGPDPRPGLGPGCSVQF